MKPVSTVKITTKRGLIYTIVDVTSSWAESNLRAFKSGANRELKFYGCRLFDDGRVGPRLFSPPYTFNTSVIESMEVTQQQHHFEASKREYFARQPTVGDDSEEHY